MTLKEKVNLFWFRRDLRLRDNVGFHKALQGKFPLLNIFIFDTEILGELPRNDARVSFISENLLKIKIELNSNDSGLAVFHGKPEEIFQKIIDDYDVQHLICNHDYEPYAISRDSQIQKFLSEKNIGFTSFKDQVIFEKDDITKVDGKPYVVYTPYKNSWKQNFENLPSLKIQDSKPFFKNLYQTSDLPYLSLEELGFVKSEIKVPAFNLKSSLIEEYESKRNFPSIDATSHVGPHLRFGTISIREVVMKALAEKNDVFLNELIWREFFMQILWHFPETASNAFKGKYDRIGWRNNESEFNSWKEGKTGFPLVDAGMRQLNTTGYMHNRVRMVVASFLCKHLLIDWRWGEAYFAEKLLDYEMSSNVGNWQWAAGSGVDAAPYFRIFNPTTQIEKFDKNYDYIRKWVPEFGSESYPDKMVDHKEARERCLVAYKNALN